jgi:hypothetical protein
MGHFWREGCVLNKADVVMVTLPVSAASFVIRPKPDKSKPIAFDRL